MGGKVLTLESERLIKKGRAEERESVLNNIIKNLMEREGLTEEEAKAKAEALMSECKPSVVDELFGIASNIPITLDEIRDERLTKQ